VHSKILIDFVDFNLDSAIYTIKSLTLRLVDCHCKCKPNKELSAFELYRVIVRGRKLYFRYTYSFPICDPSAIVASITFLNNELTTSLAPLNFQYLVRWAQSAIARSWM
jgi:hypothetical protein